MCKHVLNVPVSLIVRLSSSLHRGALSGLTTPSALELIQHLTDCCFPPYHWEQAAHCQHKRLSKDVFFLHTFGERRAAITQSKGC